MIRFSRREDYAVILITKLAQEYKKRLVSLTEIAKEYNLSLLFLRNIANDLRIESVVSAVEGKHGGYTLTRNPKYIKMGEILSAFSKDSIMQCCAIGKEVKKKGHLTQNCPKQGFCKPGYIWRKLNKDFLEKISDMSLEEFIHYS